MPLQTSSVIQLKFQYIAMQYVIPIEGIPPLASDSIVDATAEKFQLRNAQYRLRSFIYALANLSSCTPLFNMPMQPTHDEGTIVSLQAFSAAFLVLAFVIGSIRERDR